MTLTPALGAPATAVVVTGGRIRHRARLGARACRGRPRRRALGYRRRPGGGRGCGDRRRIWNEGAGRRDRPDRSRRLSGGDRGEPRRPRCAGRACPRRGHRRYRFAGGNHARKLGGGDQHAPAPARAADAATPWRFCRQSGLGGGRDHLDQCDARQCDEPDLQRGEGRDALARPLARRPAGARQYPDQFGFAGPDHDSDDEARGRQSARGLFSRSASCSSASARPRRSARVVRFLLSNEASYVTAAEIVVDGGNISSQRG
jgi:hypothetical protein